MGSFVQCSLEVALSNAIISLSALAQKLLAQSRVTPRVHIQHRLAISVRFVRKIRAENRHEF